MIGVKRKAASQRSLRNQIRWFDQAASAAAFRFLRLRQSSVILFLGLLPVSARATIVGHVSSFGFSGGVPYSEALVTSDARSLPEFNFPVDEKSNVFGQNFTSYFHWNRQNCWFTRVKGFCRRNDPENIDKSTFSSPPKRHLFSRRIGDAEFELGQMGRSTSDILKIVIQSNALLRIRASDSTQHEIIRNQDRPFGVREVSSGPVKPRSENHEKKSENSNGKLTNFGLTDKVVAPAGAFR